MDRPWTDPGPNMIARTHVGPVKFSTDQTSDRRPTVRTIYGPRVDPAWTPHGPMGGALEMDCTGEAMRGPRMDPAWTREWRTRDRVRGVDLAWTQHGPRMDP
ncbi:hypothetical protein CYMTET_16124 [Cymbomonas tetramitiformis]|uniref:Uncharacterized protein n=1 Tax=Cymbomonas tetramitiformis TaxID=36881 RepID=A0AAE0L8N2_9CHLO|nr:hypothetical protein CYMTET_16124 [Cymbomonas tetramitiformis]